MQADKKKKESMSMWKIILIVNLAVYILSFVIPSGAYMRDGKMAVPGTYEVVEKTYLNPVDVILAVGDTVYSSFGKLFVTLIIMGGMMGIVNSTGVLDRALGNLIHRLKDKALGDHSDLCICHSPFRLCGLHDLHGDPVRSPGTSDRPESSGQTGPLPLAL